VGIAYEIGELRIIMMIRQDLINLKPVIGPDLLVPGINFKTSIINMHPSLMIDRKRPTLLIQQNILRIIKIMAKPFHLSDFFIDQTLVIGNLKLFLVFGEGIFKEVLFEGFVLVVFYVVSLEEVLQ
jgi:hypothetical protein